MGSILLQFPPPPRRSNMTALEQEGLLKDIPDSVPFCCVPEYPEINIRHDGTNKFSSQQESAQLAFLPHGQTTWKQALDMWQQGGLISMLEEISENKDNAPAWMKASCNTLLSCLRWMASLRISLFQKSSLPRDEVLSKFTHVSNWGKSPLKALAWHPLVTKLAVAHKDDSVWVHSAGNSLSPVLKHKLQKQVTDLSWQPLSASVLAVACQTCVLIWHVEPTSLAVRPSSSTVQVLQCTGHSPVTSIAWSPDSSHLISASPQSTSIRVWDVPTEVSISLRRDRGGGVSLLSYSPDGSKLFTGTTSSIFRVWETKNWQCEVWSQLEGRCTSACWSPDGTVLLFAMEGESAIYAVRFSRGVSEGDNDISVMGVSVLLANVSPVDLSTGAGESVRVGGEIKNIVWDKTGERVAVMFEANELGNNNFVAVLKSTLYPVLELLPGGFVKGKAGESAVHIAFQPSFTQGALLSVVWSSGRIGYIPMHFVPAEEIPVDRSLRFGPTSPVLLRKDRF